MGIFDSLKDAALRAEYERLKLLDAADQQWEDTAYRMAERSARLDGRSEPNEKDIAFANEALGMTEKMAGATGGATRATKLYGKNFGKLVKTAAEIPDTRPFVARPDIIKQARKVYQDSLEKAKDPDFSPIEAKKLVELTKNKARQFVEKIKETPIPPVRKVVKDPVSGMAKIQNQSGSVFDVLDNIPRSSSLPFREELPYFAKSVDEQIAQNPTIRLAEIDKALANLGPFFKTAPHKGHELQSKSDLLFGLFGTAKKKANFDKLRRRYEGTYKKLSEEQSDLIFGKENMDSIRRQAMRKIIKPVEEAPEPTLFSRIKDWLAGKK